VRRNHLNHVEHFTEINKLCKVASCWLYLEIPSAFSYYGSLGQIYSQSHLRFGGDGRIKCKHCRWTLWFVRSPWPEQGYRNNRRIRVGRLDDTAPLGYVTPLTSVKMLCYQTKFKGNHSSVQGDIKLLLTFLARNERLLLHSEEGGLKANKLP